jgi:hypothetical protein
MDAKDTLVNFNNSFRNACADIKSKNIMKYVTGEDIKYAEITLAGTGKKVSLTNNSGAVMANGEQLVTREYLTNVFIPNDITLITKFELNNEKLEEKLYYTDFIINKNIQVNVTNSDSATPLTCRLYAEFDRETNSVNFTETARQILKINVIPLDYLYSTMNINLIGNSILEFYFYDSVKDSYVLYKTYSNPLYSYEMFKTSDNLVQEYKYFYSQTAGDVEKWNVPGVFHAPINFNYVPINPRIVNNYNIPPAIYSSIASNGAGICVAVGYNIISRSADNGDTWTTLDPVTYPMKKANWSSITYGAGLFVAVGNVCMTSHDGIVWTLVELPNYILKQITYANGLFVAVGNKKTGTSISMTSVNGKDWISEENVPNGIWSSITYGGGLFLAIGRTIDDLAYCMKSSDGKVWTTIDNIPSGEWRSVTYGVDKFVAVGYEPISEYDPTSKKGLSMYSYDGVNWILTQNVPNSMWNGITYGNNKFMAVSSFNNDSLHFMSSNNGIDWNIIKNIPVSYWGCVIYSSNGNTGKFISVSNFEFESYSTISQPEIITSIDGDIWSVVVPKSFMVFGPIVYSSGLFISLNNNFDNNIYTTNVLSSRDGNLWTRTAISFTGDWTCITYGDGLFVALANVNPERNEKTYRAMYSSNGIYWQPSNNVPLYKYRYITYGAGLFVGVGYSGEDETAYPVIIYSKDAIDWTESKPLPAYGDYYSIEYGNNLFVAVGSGSIIYSSNAIDWSLCINIPNTVYNSVIYENGLFVAVGNNDMVIYSEDGISWTSATNVPIANWTSVTYGEGLFLAIGTKFDIENIVFPQLAMKSTDGKNWSYLEEFDTGDIPGLLIFFKIVYGNNKFLASGNCFKTIKP